MGLKFNISIKHFFGDILCESFWNLYDFVQWNITLYKYFKFLKTHI